MADSSPFRAPFFAGGGMGGFSDTSSRYAQRSPLNRLRKGFDAILASPRRDALFRTWTDLSEKTWVHQDHPVAYLNHGRSYREQKGIFRERIAALLARQDWSYKTMGDLVDEAPSQLCLHEVLGDEDPLVESFLTFLLKYVGHERAHIDPRGVLNWAMQMLGCIGSVEHCELVNIPEPTREAFVNFFAHLDALFDYAEQQVDIGRAFFGDDRDWASMPMLGGHELAGFLTAQAHSFALRFLGAHFQVKSSAGEEASQRNTVVIEVDPALSDMRLPLMLLGPKFACDIKNTMRIVEMTERRRFKHDANDYLRGLSLVRAMRGEPIEEPVVLRINASRHTPDVWEMRLSDNGLGIIVEELFGVLAKAAERRPEALNPTLRRAAARWNAGDAFAWNRIPYGYLLEAVFHLGVSVGSGGEGSGMGLWGSTALLSRLGAQIKVGVTPRTGGFTQSIFLPMHPEVDQREVERVAHKATSSGNVV
jgi:hypothetical protein